MSLSNDDILKRVRSLEAAGIETVSDLIAEKKPTPEELKSINAVANGIGDLIINVLQNLNDIAHAANERTHWDAERRQK